MKQFVMTIFVLGCLCLLNGCSGCTQRSGPGAGKRFASYPSLTDRPRSYNWLIVKCQLSDTSTIPAGLDTSVQQFFTLSGSGFGNIVDYFHDVSYNSAYVVGSNIVGWIPAPLTTANVTTFSRTQRTIKCLEAIPSGGPDLRDYYGVVAINNVVNDAGACFTGQATLAVSGTNYNLACVWFDPNSLYTAFAAHEISHGLGLNHSYDDSGRACVSALPGEYCDPFDIMSALNTYWFTDNNFLITGSASKAGPGMNAPALLRMGWMPSTRAGRFDYEGASDQVFKIRALSHPQGQEPLVILLDVGSTTPFSGVYSIEYRQADGWDSGFSGGSTPAAVRTTGGAVLVHQYRAAGAPASTLIRGAYGGALESGNTVVLNGGNGAFHVTVDSIDATAAIATVTVGFGLGKPSLLIQGVATQGVAKIPRIDPK